MTSISQDISLIYSLRKNIRDPKIPNNILKSIENIHALLSKSQTSWKKVEWRMSPVVEQPSQQSYRASSFGNRNKNTFGQHDNKHSNHSANANHANHANHDKHDKQATHQKDPLNVKNNDSTDNIHRPPMQKYVSKFKKSSDNVEDTILYTILRGKLNKFSQSNYNEIKEFITHIIDGGETDMIKCFMKLVFEKAASEEIFCPLYAKLLSELSLQYPVLLTEMANLYAQYMEIFEEVVSQDDVNLESYNDICKRNTEKKYRRGYSQFLAELIKHNVIDLDTFMKIITKIISQIERNLMNKDSIKLIEEFADCLMKIIKAIQSYTPRKDSTDAEHIIHHIRSTLKSEFGVRIKPLSVRTADMIGLSNKARFTFLDLYEAVQKF